MNRGDVLNKANARGLQKEGQESSVLDHKSNNTAIKQAEDFAVRTSSQTNCWSGIRITAQAGFSLRIWPSRLVSDDAPELTQGEVQESTVSNVPDRG